MEGGACRRKTKDHSDGGVKRRIICGDPAIRGRALRTATTGSVMCVSCGEGVALQECTRR